MKKLVNMMGDLFETPAKQEYIPIGSNKSRRRFGWGGARGETWNYYIFRCLTFLTMASLIAH